MCKKQVNKVALYTVTGGCRAVTQAGKYPTAILDISMVIVVPLKAGPIVETNTTQDTSGTMKANWAITLYSRSTVALDQQLPSWRFIQFIYSWQHRRMVATWPSKCKLSCEFLRIGHLLFYSQICLSAIGTIHVRIDQQIVSEVVP
ncbi:hypothetical protein TNCV_2093941 [Trichonephila clavipes]|nr:hypothetical protein TNCV_2093941 [Trichonephila clavipes]